jgi:hypothetical protein
MSSGPSKTVEAIVAVFPPPACREEVLGDLHERYISPGQYAWEALLTIPLVIISRIRRTADPQVLLMQALVLYLSFLGAARLHDRAFLNEQWGLLRLAIPAGMAILGLILEDAYARLARRSPLKLTRGPVLGIGLALASQGIFRISNPDLALPIWITLYGCAIALLLSSAVRLLFPPASGQLHGVNVPADWLKRSSESMATPGARIQADRSIAAIVTLVIVVVLIAYQVWKRG